MNMKKFTSSMEEWKIFTDPVLLLLEALKEPRGLKGTSEGLRNFLLDRDNRIFSKKELRGLDQNILIFLQNLARKGLLNVILAKRGDERHVQRYYLYF